MFLKNVERLVKFFHMTAAQHLDMCALHLNKILSAIKKHFWGTHKNCAPTATRETKPDHTRPDPHRHSSIIRAVEHPHQHPHQHQLDSAAGAHHQLPVRSHYIQIIVGRTESVKFKPKNTLHLALIIL